MPAKEKINKQAQKWAALPCAANDWAARSRLAREQIAGNLGDSKWTQQQLADTLGVSKNYVAMIEAGKRDPSPLFNRALDFALLLSYQGVNPFSLSNTCGTSLMMLLSYQGVNPLSL